MSFTFFGIVSIFICLFIFFKFINKPYTLVKKSFEACVVSTIFLDIGYVAVIGGFTIEYNYLFTCLFLLSSFICLFAYHPKVNRSLKFFLIFVLFVLLTYLYHVIFKSVFLSANFDTTWDEFFNGNGNLSLVTVNSNVLQTFLRFFIFGFSIAVFAGLVQFKDIYSVSKKIIFISKLYLIYLILEFILLNLFGTNSLRLLIIDLFGNSAATFINPRIILNVQVPMGLAREPSNLALTCLYILLVSFFTMFIAKKNIGTFIGYFIVCLLIGSLSAYRYIFVVIFIAFLAGILRKKRNHERIVSIKSFLIVVASLVIVFAGVFALFGNRIENIVNSILTFSPYTVSNLETSSEIIRFYSIYNNLYYFIKYPIFGTGLGTIYSYSSTITLLTNVGVIGLVLFFVFYLSAINRGKKIKNIMIKCSLIITILSLFLLTGHLGYLLYFEKTFFVIVLIKYMFSTNIKLKVRKRIEL